MNKKLLRMLSCTTLLLSFTFVQAVLEKVGIESVKEFNSGTRDSLDRGDKMIDRFGRVITAGIIAGGTKLAFMGLTAAKGTAIVAAPYAAGTVAVGVGEYGIYKYYQSCQPSKEKVENERAHRDFEAEKKLETCFQDNKKGELNKNFIPTKCDDLYAKFALFVGDKKAKDKLETFKYL